MQTVKNQMQRFMNEQQFPSEAITSLTFAIERVFASNGKEILEKIIQDYAVDYRIKPEEISQKSKQISELSGVCEKQCNLIIYMSLVEGLKKHYINKGYPLENFNDTIKELRCKLLECYDCFGVWGMRACVVTNTHFVMTRFGIGVFQFEIIKLEKDFIVNGVALNKGDLAVNIHIPRLGKPITYQARHSSYERAKKFFRERFTGKDKIPFYCRSWILFEKHRKILKPTSNMVSFMDDFQVLVPYEYPDYNETWRIFNKPFTTLAEMPQNTSVQKAYAQIIERGEKTGGAEGVFLL